MEYLKERMERIKENEAKMRAMGLSKLASSFTGTIPISKNKKRKSRKNTSLEKDEAYMVASSNKESSSDPIHSPSSHQLDPTSVLSPTNLVTNIEQSQGQDKEMVSDTTHETEEETDDGMIRKKRGITRSKGARMVMKATKKRLSLDFNFQTRRVTCENDSSFMHECGYILRNNCSIQYKEWRHVPNKDRFLLRHKLTTLFDIDVENSNVCKVIDSYMARAWRGHRAKLHDFFKEIGGSDDPTRAKTTPPSGISKNDWEYLCDMWSEKNYLENAKKKRVMARAKRKLNSRNGSKSTIRYHIERGLDLDSSSGQLETWRLTHWDTEKGWVSEDAAAIYDEMMKLRSQNTVQSMSDKSIIENVLGRSSIRLHGWGRDPLIAENIIGTTKKEKHPTYDELVDVLQTMTSKCATMEQALIDNHIMPPLSCTSVHSQGDKIESDESTDD